jgi:hypothetical protein
VITREAIQDNASRVVQIPQAFENHADHQLVWHQIATLIVRARLLAGWRTLRHCLAEQITTGARVQTELPREQRALGTLAAALSAKQYEIHRKRLPVRPI